MEDKCKTCAHNIDKSTLDCEYACAGVTQTDGNGMVYDCEDYAQHGGGGGGDG